MEGRKDGEAKTKYLRFSSKRRGKKRYNMNPMNSCGHLRVKHYLPDSKIMWYKWLGRPSAKTDATKQCRQGSELVFPIYI